MAGAAVAPGSIVFQPLSREDFPLLACWLAAPHVLAWWRDALTTAEELEREYGPPIDTVDPTRVFVFRVGETPVGMIQCYRHSDNPTWDRAVDVPSAAGIDYLIGEADYCGRGVGPQVIAAFVPVVFGLYPEIDTIVAVPQADNRASCRALEKVGFHLLGEREIDSGDPSDEGISAVYVLPRTEKSGVPGRLLP
jgi:RimJ/RimL family protein N-acetyltransferase